jgi:hypothetical protein
VRRADNLHVPIVLKCGSLSFLEPSGAVQACNGIALPLPVLPPHTIIRSMVSTKHKPATGAVFYSASSRIINGTLFCLSLNLSKVSCVSRVSVSLTVFQTPYSRFRETCVVPHFSVILQSYFNVTRHLFPNLGDQKNPRINSREFWGALINGELQFCRVALQFEVINNLKKSGNLAFSGLCRS